MGRRIIFTVTNDLTFDQRMQRICGSLAAAGYAVTLVGRLQKKSSALVQRDYQQVRLQHLIFQKGKLFYLEFNIRLFFHLLFAPADAICSIDLDTALPGLFVAKLKQKVHVFDAHELFTHVPEVARRKSIQKAWEWVQRFTFRHTHVSYTVGPAIAEYFEQRYHRKVQVVRNMPLSQKSTSTVKPDSSADNQPFEWLKNKRFILYQGALNEGRGLESLIQAMKNIPCELVLAGEGDLSATLRDLVKTESLQHKVHFLGMIKPLELPLLTPLAYLGYNVSENVGLSYYLSLNNKFFDYTQALLPSLVNPYPEYTKLLSDFQVGLPTEPNPEAIVKHANLLLEDVTLYAGMKAACEAAAAEWIWEKEALVLLTIYRDIFENTENAPR